jgi:hypothetical protein
MVMKRALKILGWTVLGLVVLTVGGFCAFVGSAAIAGIREARKGDEGVIPAIQREVTPSPGTSEIGKTRDNPILLGSALRYGDIELTVLQLQRQANIEFRSAKEGKEYAVVTLQLRNVGPVNKTKRYNTTDFRIVGAKGIIYGDWMFEPDTGNRLGSGEFFGGSSVSGDILREVDKDDKHLVLIWSAALGTSRYLALE